MGHRRPVRPFAVLIAALVAGCAARAPVPPTWEQAGSWEHHHVDVPDRVDGAPLRMHYLAAGDPDAPRVVLLHGFPDTSFGWRDVLPALASEYRVLAPDMRGYAGTDRPRTGYDRATLAADIAAFIAATNEADDVAADTRVHLLTHDWGSATGWWVATMHGERLLTFTATSAAHPKAFADFLAQDREQRRRAGYQGFFGSPGAPGVFASFTHRQLARAYHGAMHRPEVMPDELVDIYAATFRTVADWRPPLRYYADLARDAGDMQAAIASAPPVRVPTLVLWGEHDTYLFARQAPLSCEYVAARCEVEVFADAGHHVHWDAPGSLVARWRAFVAEH